MIHGQPGRRGEIYSVPENEFVLGFDDPEGALVLSIDEWNDAMSSCTCAFVYNFGTTPPFRPGLVDVGDGFYVDTAHIEPLEHALLLDGPWDPRITAEQLFLIEQYVREHLSIDDLKAGTPDELFAVPPGHAWFPQRGIVRIADHPPGRPHGYLILSAAESNSHHGCVACLMLTSKTKHSRAEWEVAQPDGGAIVVGDVHTLKNEAFNSMMPRELPATFDEATLREVAEGLERVLGLS